jgi:DNA repair protein RadA/Sms
MTATITAASFACSKCGHQTGKWMGFCAQCRAHGTLEAVGRAAAASAVERLGDVAPDPRRRLESGMVELDRTLGGGFVPGAAVVLGGEPGIGKSTLFLQVAGALAASGRSVLVASAEESPEQVAMRAARLDGDFDSVDFLATGDIDAVIEAAGALRPGMLVVDSIQTVADSAVDGPPGGVAQVRACAARLVALAKESGTPVVMIGHVTKEGTLAGPRLVEHAVDVVLYLEGDPLSGRRFLRGLKNRFGATPSLGFFEMGDGGLREVHEPLGLTGPPSLSTPGAVLFPTVEGRRPVTVEVQALVAAAAPGMARRSVKGLEAARLHQILAVLDRHAGLSLSAHDVYVAVAGGVRVREPAADLAVALAVASSLLEIPLPSTAAWGEVGLTGRIGAVGSHAQREAEARRLGAERMIARGGSVGLVEEALTAAGLHRGSS